MKTLNQVIKAEEICSRIDAECSKCPYKATAKGWCEEKDRDALYYLKEYQEKKEELVTKQENFEEEIDKYCKLEDELNDIRRKFIEQMKNEPLTWDELKAMEGKPVWYEHEFWKGWIILGKVEQGVNCEMIPDREERWYIVKDRSAKAYRKERN